MSMNISKQLEGRLYLGTVMNDYIRECILSGERYTGQWVHESRRVTGKPMMLYKTEKGGYVCLSQIKTLSDLEEVNNTLSESENCSSNETTTGIPVMPSYYQPCKYFTGFWVEEDSLKSTKLQGDYYLPSRVEGTVISLLHITSVGAKLHKEIQKYGILKQGTSDIEIPKIYTK